MSEFFFYDTVKIVRIRDARLGILYYSLLGVMLAVAAWSLLATRSHLIPHHVAGGLFQVDVKASKVAEEADRSGNGATEGAWRVLHPVDAVRRVGNGGIFVITHVKETLVREVCRSKAGECPEGGAFEEVKSSRYSVRGAERFTLRLVHAFEAGEFDGVSKGLEGWAPFPPFRFPEGEKADKVVLTELLRAVNASLDSPSGDIGHDDEPLRNRGVTLIVTVSYSNLPRDPGLFVLPAPKPEYTYRARKIPGDARLIEAEHGPEPGTRIIRKLFGVRIETRQAGTLFSFSSSGLVVALGSTLGFIGLVTTIVDLFVMYVSRVHAPLKVELSREIKEA